MSGEQFVQSTNEYDWLGHGIYFWEANPRRGLDYARELSRNPRTSSKVTHPAVVGAVIDLGLCLDLTTTAGIERVRVAYAVLKSIVERATPPRKLPDNNKDGLRRSLDCAVINLLHTLINEAGESSFDSVKGVFYEGKEIYPDSGFYEKTHIQVCIRNPLCIKGVFRVPADQLS